MASMDMTAFASALKYRYTPEKIQTMTYQDHPLLALLTKKEDALGKAWVVPVHYSNPQGASATFATAQANKTASKLKDWTVTRNHDYVLCDIDNETLLSSQGDANAFVEAVTFEMDASISQAARRASIDLFGTGSGALSQVYTSSFAVQTLTLGNTTDGLTPNDIVKFEVGQHIVVCDTESGGTVRTGTLTIDQVDRVAGTVHTTANLSSGISAIAQNDYIYTEGDYDAKIKGMGIWIPYNAATASVRTNALAASFFGMVRSSDGTRLGGWTFDGRGMPVEEAMISLHNYIAREGGTPDYAVMSYGTMTNLVKQLGSRVMFTQYTVGVKNEGGQVVANVGFDAINLKLGKGTVKCIADADCPDKKVYMLQSNTWKLYSLGKVPRLIETDGNKILRASASDGVEARIGYYGQLVCNAPGFNGVTQIS